ncbi:MAG TPA: VWA domain-containing protein [Pyrinomonadaceae bacterium]|nr:VWA domain-containing protein [Pyrinomonadaceae bacterium]
MARNTQSHLVFRVISFVFACVAVLALMSSSAAQEKPANRERPRRALPADAEPQDVIKIDTDLVPVDVTVTDSRGRLVRNLTKEDFKLFEDGVERPIASFNVEKIEGSPRPVAIVFAIDMSGSMTPEEVARVTDAMREFSRRLAEHPATFALMTFGMNVKTIQSLTSDREKLDRAFEKLSHEPNGLSTHAYDAVDDAVRMLARHAPLTKQRQLVKRAVVVITDGFPVGDVVSPDTVIERANAADTSVYVVTMPSYTRLLAASQTTTPLPTPLDVSGLVEKTGGRSVYANQNDLGPLFRAIAEEVAAAYVLGFYPPVENRKDGRAHTIRIEGPAGLTLRQSRDRYQSQKPEGNKQ